MITISDEALRRLGRVLRTAPIEVRGLRISAERGCGSFRYSMALETEIGEHDAVINLRDVPIVLDPWSQLLLAATRIDFREDAEHTGFVFESPDQLPGSSCGGCAKVGTC